MEQGRVQEQMTRNETKGRRFSIVNVIYLNYLDLDRRMMNSTEGQQGYGRLGVCLQGGDKWTQRTQMTQWETGLRSPPC